MAPDGGPAPEPASRSTSGLERVCSIPYRLQELPPLSAPAPYPFARIGLPFALLLSGVKGVPSFHANL